MKITTDRARELFARMAGRRILVAGDLILDRFIYGTVSRVSPEAPIPVVDVTGEKGMPGGAGNVCANVATLGGRCRAASVLGDDAHGSELLQAFGTLGVDCGAVHRLPGSQTTVKTRVIAERQQVVRVDRERYPDWTGPEKEQFALRLREAVRQSDALILEDYGKGALEQDVVDILLEAAHEAGIPVGYDPKDTHPLEVRGIAFASPNRRETFAVAGRPYVRPVANPLDDRPLIEAGRILQQRWDAEVLLVTLSEHGMLLLEQGAAPQHIPTRAREVFDVSGAGDTVIAAYMLALAAGAGFIEAAELANFAAGVVVGKIGTACCTQEELLAYMRTFPSGGAA
jgi:D-beta-D-heptose 7-phosphate kinase/D-beta-D-heptose 1-phosphate adenosyltransferase